MANRLVWFLNDLRTDDHGPLAEACRKCGGQDGIYCVFVIDPHWFGSTSYGFDRVGPHRRRFLKETLIDLSDQLARRGSRLDVIRGSTVDVLVDLVGRFGIDTVHAHREWASEEKSLQRRVGKALRGVGAELRLAPPQTLFDPDALPFSVAELPEVFSKFRRKVEKACDVAQPLPAPEAIPAPPAAVPETLDLNALPELDHGSTDVDPRGVLEFRGGETAAWRRIEQYFFENDCLKRYKKTRNGMLGADYSSKLSPWLAAGALSARRVHHAVRRYEEERVANESTYWLIFELLWRDYFKFVAAKHGGAMFTREGIRGMALPWSTDPSRFESWRDGQTGFPLIDANMRELAATGFMSNRGRQNVASFLTKNLGIDWRMGAEWFESMLLDYDPASNYGNWNYNAGVGNDARGFRWFNTLKQAQQYDPRGDYVRHWLPVLEGVPENFVHSPWEMHAAEQKRSGCVLGTDYPHPVVDLFRSADHHRALYEQA